MRKECSAQYMSAYQCLQEADSKGAIQNVTKILTEGSVNERVCQKVLQDF